MRFIIFLSVMCISLSAIAQGTGSIRGKLTDKTTGEEILFATVIMKQNDVFVSGAHSDYDGNYRMDNLQPGEYDVEVTYLGYQKSITKKVVITIGAITNVDIKLSTEPEIIGCDFGFRVHRVPLISPFGSGKTMINTDIDKLPIKN